MGLRNTLRCLLKKKQEEIPGKVRMVEEDGWDLVDYHKLVGMDSYEILAEVGSGATSKVYAARERDTGKLVALKIMEKGRLLGMAKKVNLEKDVMASLRDIPQVLRVLNTYQTDHTAVFTTELMLGGDLFSYITQHPGGRLPLDLARYYTKSLVQGLMSIHAQKVIYRDLKCENILLAADGSLRIADFGLSREFPTNQERCHSFVGTAHYIAPEVIKGGGYAYEADWWSLGIVVYNMVTGMNPFSGSTFDQIFRAVVKGKFVYPEEVKDFIPEDCKQLIHALLTTDPKSRLTGADVLSHPWVAGASDEVPQLVIPVPTEVCEMKDSEESVASMRGKKLSKKEQELFADFDSSFESESGLDCSL